MVDWREGSQAPHLSATFLLGDRVLSILSSNGVDGVELEPSTLSLVAVHVHDQEPVVISPGVELVVEVIGWITGGPGQY